MHPMRLRLGVFALLACAFVVAGAAAGAADPAQAVFRVTLSGTLTKEWTFTRAETAGDCTETTRAVGKWQVRLATRRPTRVRAVAVGRRIRFVGAKLGAIAGSGRRSGTMTLSASGGPSCERTSRSVRCGAERRAFRGGSTSLANPRRGVLRLAPLGGARSIRSFSSKCPEEPGDIRAIRTDLPLASGPLSADDVFARNVPRFFVTGDSEQETTIEGDDVDGRVTERVRWTVTFTRLAH